MIMRLFTMVGVCVPAFVDRRLATLAALLEQFEHADLSFETVCPSFTFR